MNRKLTIICINFSIGRGQFYELVENILHGFLLKIISETSQTPTKTFLWHFEQIHIVFSDISQPRLGKNDYSYVKYDWISKKSINYVQTVKSLVLD